MSFTVIKPEEMDNNIFETLNDWMLLSAGTAEENNTMTVSWGGVGIMWRKPVAITLVRPQRYTYEFMEKNDYFTLNSYPQEMHEKLVVCGSKSGRDIDKVKECELTVAVSEQGGVYYEEAELVIVCKKMYYDEINPDNFVEPSIADNYPNKDYHRMYIGEIVEVLKKA